MVRIYTKTGDNGTTSLFGGQRVNKDSIRIEACGQVDELNSFIGIILSAKPEKWITNKLARTQRDLFKLGADLASIERKQVHFQRINKNQTKRLEREIDQWSGQLPALKNFILPNGTALAANLHYARAITRRLERTLTQLARQDKINKNILPFVNRLSDWFFTLARKVNHQAKVSEAIWQVKRRK